MKLYSALFIVSSLTLCLNAANAGRIQEKKDARRQRIEDFRGRGRRPTPTPTPATYPQSITIQGKAGSLAEKLYGLFKDQYEGRNDHGITNVDGMLSLIQTANDKVECSQVAPASSNSFRCSMVGAMKLGRSESLGFKSIYNVTISSGLLFNSAAGRLFRLIYNTTASAVSAHDPKTDYFQVKMADPGEAKSPHSLTCELDGVPAPVALDVRTVRCSYRGLERPTRFIPKTH